MAGAKPKDKLFAEQRGLVKDFNFGKETAAVFDDMLDRSVPFYGEIERMIGEIAADFARAGTNVYDMGCSTCNTFIAMDPFVPSGVRFVGVDSSPEMLKRGREKLRQYRVERETDLVCADLNQGVEIKNASVVVMTLTLQFIRPLYRHKLIRDIAKGLNEKGALLIVEKLVCENPTVNRLFIKYYYDFKERNGYSRLEIAQKREVLENVLIPYRLEENAEMLLHNGFRHCEVFFKWYNFCGLLALK